jgi:rRNA maturation endonuclease Nob1
MARDPHVCIGCGRELTTHPSQICPRCLFPKKECRRCGALVNQDDIRDDGCVECGAVEDDE